MQTYINNLVRCNALVSAGPQVTPLIEGVSATQRTIPISLGQLRQYVGVVFSSLRRMGSSEGHADVMEPWLSKVRLKALLEQIFLSSPAFRNAFLLDTQSQRVLIIIFPEIRFKSLRYYFREYA